MVKANDSVTLVRVNDGAMIPYSNLVVNGFGENKKLEPFASVLHSDGKFVLGDAPIDCYGYFNNCASDLIPYDPNTEYELSYWFRLNKNLSSGKAYFALVPYDIDKNMIVCYMTPALNNYTYKLAKDVEAGDKYIYFEDLTNWSVAIYHWYIAFYNYTDSTGYTYPVGTYTRNVIQYGNQSNVDKANNRIKLASPYSGATIPKSTPVMQHIDRDTYPYYGQRGVCTSHEWKHWTNLSIKQTDDVTLKVTKYLRLGFTNGSADFAGVSLMPKGAKGDKGDTGADGISPTVSVSKTGSTTTISITDKNGTHTQTVLDGVNGTPGAKGADGKTPYFHVKYSNDGGSTFTSNSGETVGTYIGTCTDYNSADPTTVGSYTWARIKGDTGAKGDTGKGATSIIEQYYLSTSSTTQAGGSWSTTQPTWSSGKYIFTRSHITWTDGTTTDTTPVLAGGLNSANQNAFNANNTANNANNTANSAQSTANSKNAIFYATSAPSGSHKVNDVWFDTAHGNKMYYWTGSTWSSGLFDTAAIKDGAVTGKLIAGQTITGDKIASRTIVATNIAAATITANEILGGTITADEIASRTITADKIKAGAITSNEIAAGTITANNIASRAITADRIKAGTITANEIYGGTITADKINMNSLQANLAYVGNKSGRHIEIASDAVKLMLDGSTILGSFGSGGISLGNVFSVDSSGNGSYSGKITAKSGTIGGWTIQDSQLYIKNQQGNEVFLRNGDIGVQDVLVVKSGDNYPFWIRADGSMLATKGTIGGWTIDSSSLSRSTTAGSRTTKSLLADGKYAIYGNETANDLVYNVSHTYDFIGYNYTRSWQFDDTNHKTCAILEYNKDTYDDYIFHMYNTGTTEEILMKHGGIRITGDLRVGADTTWAPGSYPAHLGGNVRANTFNSIKLKNLIQIKYLTASNKKFVKNGSSNNTISVPAMSGYNLMGVYAATIDSDKVYPFNSYYDGTNKVFHVLGHNISGTDVTTAIHGIAFYIANV